MAFKKCKLLKRQRNCLKVDSKKTILSNWVEKLETKFSIKNLFFYFKNKLRVVLLIFVPIKGVKLPFDSIPTSLELNILNI